MAKIAPLRILFVGDAHAGKTTLIERLMFGRFVRYYVPTVGCACHYDQRAPRPIELWELGGLGKPGPLRGVDYGNPNVVVLVVAAD